MYIRLLEITAIPMQRLISNETAQALQNILQGFQSLLNQIHALSSGQNTSIEIILISGEQSKTRVHNPVRIIAATRCDTSEAVVENFITAIKSHLASNNYLTNEMSENEVESIAKQITDISSKNLSVIVKSEKIVTSPLSYTGYYYYADILLPNGNKMVDNFASLIQVLEQQANSFVSFQLLPTMLSPHEEYAIQDLANSMKPLVQGVLYQGETLQEPYAAMPFQSYNYYSQRMGHPLFTYNIMAASLSDAAPITARILSLVQSSVEALANLECLSVNPTQGLRFDFDFFPWQLNNLLMQSYRNPAIWGGGIIAPINLARLPFVISTEEASTFFRLPIDDGMITGIEKNTIAASTELLRESVIFNGNIVLGKQKNNPTVTIGASEKAFTQHATIVGVPGTGKTTFALNLLMQFHQREIPFLAIEPTKKEYRALLNKIPELQIFTPGNNNVSPFIINPFIPPKGVSVEQYVPSLANAFKAAFNMVEPLDIIFLSAIRACYLEYGWKDYSCFGDSDIHPFGLYEFILTFNRIVNESEYKGEIKGTLQSAGTFRLLNLIEQNSNIYDSVNTVPLEDILTCPTVIELNAIDNAEFKSLLMALVFINVCVYAKHNQIGDGKLQNVLLIDEAHVLLDDAKATNSQEKSGNSATQLVQNMVAEVRALGTSVIIADQSPHRIGRNIIDNTDIKIAFRLVGNEARGIIADATDMDDYSKQHLSHLDAGEAFVYYRDVKSPQLVITPDIRRQENISFSIADSEVLANNRYWEHRKDKLIPYRECRYADTCRETCDFKVRANSEYYASHLVSRIGANVKDKNLFIRYLYLLHELIIQLAGETIDKSELSRLCNCTKIKFMRKMQLRKLDIILTKAEINKWLPIILIGDNEHEQ